jgi:RNA polymerase sigma factor (sigma-70 family)
MSTGASKNGSEASSRVWPIFATTHWSVVRAAGQSDSTQASDALQQLCSVYWYPLYAFVRRQGHSSQDAEDLTQEFFARFLAKQYFGRADPALGRFRNFLLASLKHFLSEQWRQVCRLKRGGGQSLISWDSQTAEQRYRTEPADPVTPEIVYDRRWALTLLERALARLDEEQSAAGNGQVFARLRDYVWGENSGTGYDEVAARLGISAGALKVMVHRLRQRYRKLLREEVAHTVATPEEIDEELRYLARVIRG